MAMIDRRLEWIELRRLGNGWVADVCPMPKTPEEAKEVLEIVNDGIRALQSTDELGHPEITKKAVEMEQRLQKKATMIEKIIKKARVVE
jgi:hypothetical protein